MNIERLVKLAAHLEALPRTSPKVGFNMREFYSHYEEDHSGCDCVTTGCMAWHAVSLFSSHNKDFKPLETPIKARHLLDLTEKESNKLFYLTVPRYFIPKIKPAAAAKAIYRLIAGDEPWPNQRHTNDRTNYI